LLEKNIPQIKKPIDQFNDVIEKNSILITKLGNSVLDKLYLNAVKTNVALNTTLIRFELSTENSSQCLFDPYKIDTIKIYFVERDFNNTSISEYVDTYEKNEDKIKLENAYKATCEDPSEANIINLKKIKNQLDGSKISNTFYFNSFSFFIIYIPYSSYSRELFNSNILFFCYIHLFIYLLTYSDHFVQDFVASIFIECFSFHSFFQK
jgi:hypothetical protein